MKAPDCKDKKTFSSSGRSAAVKHSPLTVSGRMDGCLEATVKGAALGKPAVAYTVSGMLIVSAFAEAEFNSTVTVRF